MENDGNRGEGGFCAAGAPVISCILSVAEPLETWDLLGSGQSAELPMAWSEELSTSSCQSLSVPRSYCLLDIAETFPSHDCSFEAVP